MDYSKYIGKTVSNYYGKEGTLISVDDHIVVMFDKECKYNKSDAFLKYLSFTDEAVQNEIEAILKKEQDEIELEKKVKIHAAAEAHKGSSDRKKGTPIEITDKLVRDIPYGKAAREIYEKCCKEFGWDKTKSGAFDKQQHLFAADATPENESVWFLSHSNLGKDDGGSWKNTVSKDLSKIEEKWLNDSPEFDDNCTENRIVFVKEKDDCYYFLGIYGFAVKDNVQRIKTYTLLKNEYLK